MYHSDLIKEKDTLLLVKILTYQIWEVKYLRTWLRNSLHIIKLIFFVEILLIHKNIKEVFSSKHNNRPTSYHDMLLTKPIFSIN